MRNKKYDKIKQEISKILRRNHNFSKKDKIYTRIKSDLFQIIEFQSDKNKSFGKISFTINVGLFVNDIAEVYYGDFSGKPEMAMGALHTRLSSLAGEDRDIWYDFENSENINEYEKKKCAKISDTLKKYSLVFFEKYENKKLIAEYLSSSAYKKDRMFPISEGQRRAYAAIIFSRIGMTSKARANFKEAVDLTRGGPLESVIDSLVIN